MPFRMWYNVGIAVIIPAHTIFCVYRRKLGAEIRRRPISAERMWYNDKTRTSMRRTGRKSENKGRKKEI